MPDALEKAATSPSGLDRLLAALDPDRDRAAAKLLLLRAKLVNFFAWSRAKFPDELADEALDRVAKRLAAGETIRSADAGAYAYGFARNVLRESWSRPRLVEAPPSVFGAPDGSGEIAERRSRCLDRCLDRLPAESRRLLLDYYRIGEGATKAETHRRLAAALGISPGNLRLKVHRLRVGALEVCVRACLAREAETETSQAHVEAGTRDSR